MNPFPEFVLIHLAHDSTVLPAAVQSQFAIGEDLLTAELGRMTDHQTLALFASDVPKHQIVYATVSRLVVDVERFEADHLEPMSVRGMGVVYTSTSDGSDGSDGLLLRRPIAASKGNF